MSKFSRNYGIDILRIVSILGVVFLHVLGHGGFLKAAQSLPDFSLVWFLEILAYPAVNCFVLISGYVGYRGAKAYPRLKNMISLLFIVLFYSIGIALIFKLLYPANVGLLSVLKACLPTITKQYWFFTAYFGMMLLSPLLNVAVYSGSKKQLFIYAAVFTLLSGLSLLKDSFSLLEGYSVIWFVLLYTLGAIIKKYDLTEIFSGKICILVITAAFFITWLSKTILHFAPISVLQKFDDVFVSYTSPTIVLMAVGLLCLFSKISFQNPPVSLIAFFSSSAFSVYLIHDNTFVRKYLISTLSGFASQYSTAALALFIIGAVLGVFLSCVLIDKIRIALFNVCRADKIAENMESAIKKTIQWMYERLT